MYEALIQTFLIIIIIFHINEAITLTISFQLVISLFNLVFKISLHSLFTLLGKKKPGIKLTGLNC